MITWWLCYGLAMCLQCFGDVLSIFCKYFNDVSPLCLQCSPFVFLYQNQTHRFHPSCDRHALSLLPPTAIVTLAALISQAQQELLASSDISCQSVTCNTYPEGWVVLGSNSPKHCKVIAFSGEANVPKAKQHMMWLYGFGNDSGMMRGYSWGEHVVSIRWL